MEEVEDGGELPHGAELPARALGGGRGVDEGGDDPIALLLVLLLAAGDRPALGGGDRRFEGGGRTCGAGPGQAGLAGGLLGLPLLLRGGSVPGGWRLGDSVGHQGIRWAGQTGRGVREEIGRRRGFWRREVEESSGKKGGREGGDKGRATAWRRSGANIRGERVRGVGGAGREG